MQVIGPRAPRPVDTAWKTGAPPTPSNGMWLQLCRLFAAFRGYLRPATSAKLLLATLDTRHGAPFQRTIWHLKTLLSGFPSRSLQHDPAGPQASRRCLSPATVPKTSLGVIARNRAHFLRPSTPWDSAWVGGLEAREYALSRKVMIPTQQFRQLTGFQKRPQNEQSCFR